MCIYKEDINSHNQIEIDEQMKRNRVLQFIKVEKNKCLRDVRIQRLLGQFTDGQRSNPTRKNLIAYLIKIVLKTTFLLSKVWQLR